MLAFAIGANYFFIYHFCSSVSSFSYYTTFSVTCQLFCGTTAEENNAVEQTVTSVSLGTTHSAAITLNGGLYTWGRNNYGQLGDGTKSNHSTPEKIMDNVVEISLGEEYSAAITADGLLYTWGKNDYGQLGDGTTTDRSTPEKINLENVIAVSLGKTHAAAVTADGSLYTWGNNEYGQLGNHTTSSSLTPVLVNDVVDVKAISLGDYHSMALTNDGTLYTWGYNVSGQLGNGSSQNSADPIKVFDNVSSISAGQLNSALITTGGTLYLCGENDHYQIGDEETIVHMANTNSYQERWGFNYQGITTGTYFACNFDQNQPKEILSGISFVELGSACTAVDKNGFMYVWGTSSGYKSKMKTPDKVDLTNVTASYNGTGNYAALTSDGSLYTWGNNSYGQLGDGTKTDRSSPKKIVILGDAEQCGDNLYYTIKNGEAIITGTGDMWDFNNEETEVGKDKKSPFTAHKDEITSVKIPDGITRIGADAFNGCTNITSDIDLPDSLQSIGKNAFADTNIYDNQTYVTTGSIVKYIDNWAVGYDRTYDETSDSVMADVYYLSLNENTIGIADEAFCELPIVHINLSNSLNYIGADAFRGAPYMKSVTIPQNVATIGRGAFSTSSLRTITFQNCNCKIDGDSTSYTLGIGNEDNGKIRIAGRNNPKDNPVKAFVDKNPHYEYVPLYQSTIFMPETDGNSFLHSNRDIGGGYYGTKGNTFKTLEMLKAFKNSGINHNFSAAIKKFKNNISEWQGSCYGVDMTASMTYNHTFDVPEFVNSHTGTTAKNYYSIGRPCDNEIFYDLIQYFFITQYLTDYRINSAWKQDILAINYSEDKIFTLGVSSLEDTLKSIVSKTLNSNQAYVLEYKYMKDQDGEEVEAGHVLVLSACVQMSDKYLVYAYDLNRSTVVYIDIALDYSTFSFVDAGENHIGNTGSDSYVLLALRDPDLTYSRFSSTIENFDLYLNLTHGRFSSTIKNFDSRLNLAKSASEENMIQMVFADNSDFEIVNSENQKISYSHAGLNADMSELSLSPIITENVQETLISTKYSDLLALANHNETIDITIYDTEGNLFSIEGKNVANTSFDFASDTLSLTGTNMTYTAFVSTGNEVAENEEGLVSISGEANGTVIIKAENGTVTVTTEEPQSNMVVASYIGNDTKQETIKAVSDFTFTIEDGGSIQAEEALIETSNLGDVNGDGKVNALDAATILVEAAHIGAGSGESFTDEQKFSADVNKDDKINATDAASILVYAAEIGAGSFTGTMAEFMDTK